MPGQNPSQTGLTGPRLCGTELHKLLRRIEGPVIEKVHTFERAGIKENDSAFLRKKTS